MAEAKFTGKVGDKLFVDTNILIYANLATSPFQQVARQKLMTSSQNYDEFWISRQVIREYLSVMSRPDAHGNTLAVADLIQDIQEFQKHFLIADETGNNTDKLLELFDQIALGGKQIHDANIVATMLCYNIPNLLTHNVADFKRFDAYITIIPLM